MARKRRDPKTGKFANSIREQKRNHISKLAQDVRIPLTEIAKIKGVSLETVIRLANGRLSQRQVHRLYFDSVKESIKPAVEHIASRKKAVTVKSIIEYVRGTSGVELTRHIVSKALRALEAEGVQIGRPKEYAQANAMMRKRQKALEATDNKIVELRKKLPNMRDEELAKKVGLNYYALRKRVTALKKAGRLPNVRRGYRQK